MSDISNLTRYLELKYALVLLTTDQDSTQPLMIREPIAEWEAKYFLKGLHNNLFLIDDQGYVQSPFLPKPPQGSTKQKMIQTFWNHGGGKRALYRESINQLATACRLVYEFGWEADDIKMEPSIEEFGGCAYGVDIILLGPNGNILFCCENKSSTKEFDKLIRQFHSCCAIGDHEKVDCTDKENHGKYRFCTKAKPMLFWAVSPHTESLYALTYEDNGVITCKESSQLISKEDVLSAALSEYA